jgi:hypothetical protein
LLSLSNSALSLAKTLFGLFGDDPTEKILKRIDELQQIVEQGFQDLGAQLNQEIGRVIADLDTLANQEAIAHAITAERDLYLYKLIGDSDFLVSAANESSLATAFLEQQTDPFYIAGLLCAGNARFDVFRALDPAWVQDPVLVGEADQLINCLEAQINTVRTSVESLHAIVLRYYVDPVDTSGPSGKPTRDGVRVYYYVYLDRDVVVNTFDVEDYATQRDAFAAAQQERLKGITDELAFLSIPNFELTLNTWKQLINPEQ